MHALTENKNDNSKDIFCEEIEQVLYLFFKYHLKILLGVVMQNFRQKIFTNLQLGRRVYMQIIMIMVLD
jgi:hypothetical protein